MRGFVVKLIEKSGKTNRGKAWTKYSFKTEDESGNESDWITFGFEAPPFKEGDFIEFDVAQQNGFTDYKKGSGRIVSNPPQRAGANSSARSGASGGVGGATPDAARTPDVGRMGDVAAGNVGADRQTQIVLQHSQEMAVSLVGILLAQDALPISKGANKGAATRRFAEIVSYVDKFTVKFHNDVATGRLLEVVADMGIVDVKPDAPLPEAGSAEKPSPSESGEY